MTGDLPLILVVGPEEEALQAVMIALERRGYASRRVNDVEGALNALASTSIAATLVYLSPTATGPLDVIQILRQTYPSLPHLVLAAPEAEASARASGRVPAGGVVVAQPDDEGVWAEPLERALATRERARRRDRLRGSIP